VILERLLPLQSHAPQDLSGYNTHRAQDKQAMLDVIGVAGVEALFAAAPPSLRLARPLNLPPAMPEWALERHMRRLAESNADVKTYSSFLGGGAYEHYRPAVIEALVSRGEFLTSYTPYQPEMSQGLLQALFEYQAALSIVTGLPVVNGSCYDGATALADAAWTCCRISGKDAAAALLVSEGIWTDHRSVIAAYMNGRGVLRHAVPQDAKTGEINAEKLHERLADIKPAGFLFQTPNALGIFEDVKAIAEICAAHGVVSVCSFHPLAAGIVTPPGLQGIDIVVCDGQPLGLPLNAGGPSLGVFAAKQEYRRYVPGRLVGKVADRNGNPAYALVHEEREQHIARDRATSNICSNQALNALRAVIYLALLGERGLERIAALNARKAHYLAENLSAVPGVQLAFGSAFFNEFVITLAKPAAHILREFRKHKIFGGIDYSGRFGLQHALLVCATEIKSRAALDAYVERMKEAMK
jgi:glycine dehydrogenase subunit 1